MNKQNLFPNKLKVKSKTKLSYENWYQKKLANCLCSNRKKDKNIGVKKFGFWEFDIRIYDQKKLRAKEFQISLNEWKIGKEFRDTTKKIEGVKKYNIYGMYILWDLDFF